MEEGSRLDLRLERRREKLVASFRRDLHAAHPDDRLIDRIERGREPHAGDALERFPIHLRDVSVARQGVLDAPVLRMTDRRLQVGDALIVTDPFVPVERRRDAVVAQQADRPCASARVGQAHAAFAGGNDLVGVEGKARDVAELPTGGRHGAHRAPRRSPRPRRCRVGRRSSDRSDLRGPAVEVDWNDRLRARQCRHS